MKTGCLIVLLFAFLLAFTSFSYGQVTTIFNNGNIDGVLTSPTVPTTFYTKHFYRITSIMTYHWNNGYGQPGGSIALIGENGVQYGPWNVGTAPGQGGVPNAYWYASPNVIIPPGTYTILDSSPETWAQNDGSGGQGIAEIKGIRVRARK